MTETFLSVFLSCLGAVLGIGIGTVVVAVFAVAAAALVFAYVEPRREEAGEDVVEE